MKKLVLSFSLLGILFIIYLTNFPNDFFLSTRPFYTNKERFFYKKNFFSFVLLDKTFESPQLLKIINNPDQYLVSSNQILKDNDKRTIVKLTSDSKTIILKRYNYSGLYDWITKCPFRSSKAYRAWYYHHQLLKNGIETAKPIAIIEKRLGPFWKKTYLISEYIEGQTLSQKLREADETIHKEISGQIITALNIFYKQKWLHRDLVSRNVIVYKNKIAIIDLDEMHSYAFNNNLFKSKFHKKHFLKLIEKSGLSRPFIDTFLMTHNQLKEYIGPAKEFYEFE